MLFLTGLWSNLDGPPEHNDVASHPTALPRCLLFTGFGCRNTFSLSFFFFDFVESKYFRNSFKHLPPRTISRIRRMNRPPAIIPHNLWWFSTLFYTRLFDLCYAIVDQHLLHISFQHDFQSRTQPYPKLHRLNGTKHLVTTCTSTSGYFELRRLDLWRKVQKIDHSCGLSFVRSRESKYI